jgi:hypothetical protein
MNGQTCIIDSWSIVDKHVTSGVTSHTIYPDAVTLGDTNFQYTPLIAMGLFLMADRDVYLIKQNKRPGGKCLV